MKKYSAFLGVLVCLSSVLAVSCHFEFPSKVVVKAEPKYEVPLGSVSKDPSSMFGMEKMQSLLGGAGGSGIEIYDFINTDQGNEDVLTYAIHYPMFSVPFDLSAYLDGMNIDDMLAADDALNFTQEITLPEIKKDVSLAFSKKDLQDVLHESTSGDLGSMGKSLTVSETGTDINTIVLALGSHNSLTRETVYCEGMQYSQDSSIILTVTRTDTNPLSSGFVFNLEVSIPSCNDTSANGTPIVYNGSTTGSVDVRNGGTLVLPVDKGTLPSNYTINLGGDFHGGTAGTEHSYTLSFAMSDNTSIVRVIEVHPDGDPANPDDDMDLDPIAMEEQSFDLGATVGSLIKSATIANDGESYIQIQSANPDGWSGVGFDLSGFTISGAGLNSSGSDFDDLGGDYLINSKLDLGGKTLTPSEGTQISVTGSVKVKVEDGANLYFGEDGGETEEVEISVKTQVVNIASAVADLSSLGGFKLDSTSANPVTLPNELAQYVKKITFGQESGGKYYKSDENGNSTSTLAQGVGLECKVVNSLPEGNDIELTMSSSLLGLSETPAIAPAGNTVQDVSWTSYNDINLSSSEEAIYVDLEVALPENQTLVDLTMGSTYTVSVSDVKFVFDWDSLEVKVPESAKKEGEFDMASMNFASMLSGLGFGNLMENIELDKVNVYFYMEKPQGSLATALGALTLDGSITASYDKITGTDSEGNPITTSETQNILAEGETSITWVDKIDWPASGSTLTEFPEPSFAAFDASSLLANDKTNLKLSYEFSLKGDSTPVTIYHSALDSMAENDATEFNVSLAAAVPLKLNIKSPVSVDLMGIISSLASGESASEDTGSSSDPADPSDPSDPADPADPSDPSGTSSEDEGPGDLLKRSSEDAFANYAVYAKYVSYVSIEYNAVNKVIPGLSATICVNDKDHGDSAYTYSNVEAGPYPISEGKNELKFTGKDAEAILTHWFSPKIELTLPTGDIYISRSGLAAGKDGLGASLLARVKFDTGEEGIDVTELINSMTGSQAETENSDGSGN